MTEATLPPQDVPISPWKTAEEIAKYLHLRNARLVYWACGRGDLRHARINGKREIRIRVEWADEWMERHANGGLHEATREQHNTREAVMTHAVVVR